MNRSTITRFAMGLTLALVLGSLGAPALAAPGVAANPSPAASGAALTAMKARCNSEVQRREATLTADASRINGAAELSSSDRSALLGIEQGDSSGLNALNATIQADTTLEQAHSDCQKIVNDYRIYALFEPQMHVVIAADVMTSVTGKVASLAATLQQKLAGNSNPAVQTTLADLANQVAAAQAGVGGVDAGVLALTPSGYPGNEATLKAAHASLTSARADLKKARADIDTIRDALKATTAPSPTP